MKFPRVLEICFISVRIDFCLRLCQLGQIQCHAHGRRFARRQSGAAGGDRMQHQRLIEPCADAKRLGGLAIDRNQGVAALGAVSHYPGEFEVAGGAVHDNAGCAGLSAAQQSPHRGWIGQAGFRLYDGSRCWRGVRVDSLQSPERGTGGCKGCHHESNNPLPPEAK